MRPTQGRWAPLVVLTLAAAACTSASSAEIQGVAGTPANALEKRAAGENGAVAAAHPLAAEAGLEMLQAGGNAVDAAVAVGFALNVVEPMMSGVGGGGSALIWLQDEGRSDYVDFYSATRASAWQGALPDTGAVALRDVGVPGAVGGFLEMHERYGTLPLARILEPAIRLADQGFPMNLVLHDAIESNRAKLLRHPDGAARFLPEGTPPAVGSTFRQPELAETLRRIAGGGRAGFYEGETAEAIVRVVRAGGNPLRMEDFAAYRPQWDKRPLCADYRGRVVLSAPPPQTGLRVIHGLNLLEAHDLAAEGLPTVSGRALHLLSAALRAGASGSIGHNNDPNWAVAPAAGVASEAYALERAALVGDAAVAGAMERGDPSAFDAEPPSTSCAIHEPYGAAPVPVGAGASATSATGVEQAPDLTETTHFSVVDREGNAVALSTTLSPYFGSGAWAAGFFLNSSAVDFSSPNQDPTAEARSEWRVRSSTISPTIVLENGRVRTVIGSPGGGRIPGAILQGLVYVLDYGLDPFEAVSMPRILTTPATTDVEVEHGFPGAVLGELRAMGWNPVTQSPGYARLYLISRMGNQWVAAADPRHDGAARAY